MMKETTQNEYNKTLNQLIDYVNLNLNKDISLKQLACIANCSEYHFHRIFRAFIGESLGAYINRLRCEKAASILKMTNKSIVEIAEDIGYSNQQALSKAFKKHFGISPSAFRNLDNFYSSNEKKRSFSTINIEPEIRFEKKKQLVYIRIIAGYGSEKEYTEAWSKLAGYAYRKNLYYEGIEAIGLSFDDPSITKGERCRFYACLTTKFEIKPEAEFGTMSLAAGKFAVFTLKGSYNQLRDTYDQIYSKYIVSGNFELRNTHSFEKYLNSPDKVKEEDLLTEIYIPIK